MGTYEITVEDVFKAGHAVRLALGRFERTHSHRWRVAAAFRSRKLTEPMGVVLDFTVVTRELRAVCAELDGADLNVLPSFVRLGCSAERLAKYLAGRLTKRLGQAGGGLLWCVSVSEAPGCQATYYTSKRHS